ncbi:mannan endo-1,4-beta-mannosidase 6-like [Magnolia sinica]|uniref:mannan endo-1,4-beta-mannosidase 6-like n=1 Tax=Magnolia sinica TaxID=86752 RepID=UPI002657F979|nr:mannan endo-1,4-beta-mannosidase 6-like [Magnolia sinica]
MWDAERRKALYRSILGLASILAILYLNFGDKFRFPVILWQPRMGFISTVNSSHLFIDQETGHPLAINGWNSYWLMDQSIWAGPSRQRVSEMLSRGAGMGMTVCRTWAFSDGGPNALQTSPGVFDERVFQALDFVIAEARKHRIRLILSLVNNLNAFGGKAQYVRWAQAAGVNVTSTPDSFFSDSTIKGYYKDYVKTILTRKNSYSRVKYSEEPAIFAWELMNEPRCESSSSAAILQAWIAEMAAFIKSLDQKHLLTVGLEGFYGPKTSERAGVNPGVWADSLGSDFIKNSAIEHIDFASVHAYPDSWIPNADLEEKVKYLSRWVDSHVSDGEYILKKPVLFTEVGSSLHGQKQGLYDRDVLLKTVYDKIYQSTKKKQAGAGALIWQLMVEGLEGKEDEFSLVAWEHPSTYKLIVEQSCRLRREFEGGEMGRKISHSDPCSGLIPGQ